MVVARVRLNRIDTDAYAQCFMAIFYAVAKDHPMFKIGVSLNIIIADWSDQQANGLEIAIGKRRAARYGPKLLLAIKLVLLNRVIEFTTP